ncbi:MAG: MgtC/SapB family protein [Candidatus Pacebacteria bacterium]|nr:MgtC/SapB family protein [Candidatus Paceibacterota bacterium]
MEFIGPIEMQFLTGLALSIFVGLIIGIERESRGKDAGISTHMMVVAGSMLFTLLSMHVDPNSTSRIAAQVITGIGFLGAGLVLKEGEHVKNLTTAASLWYSAALGMSIGFGFYAIAIIGGIAAAVIPRFPSLRKKNGP